VVESRRLGKCRHGVEIGETLDGKRGRIEPGRWYDIKVEVNGRSVKCSLDDKIIHDIKIPSVTAKTLFASATRDTKTRDIIVKVVNSSATATETEINLGSAAQINGFAQAFVLTSGKPTDENTLEEPTKVSPKTETQKISGNKFTRPFPGNSFTVLRIPSP
jgi:alpha-L-arabinofuranosidase